MPKISKSIQEAIHRGPARDLSAQEFDAVVIGGGASGGLAALLLCEAGRKVLLLDAGPKPAFARRPWTNFISAVTKYAATPEMFARLPAFMSNFGRKALRAVGLVRQPVQSRCFAWQMSPNSFVDDRDNPYSAVGDQDFTWFRTRQLGGRMIVPGHGRQYYRHAPIDFQAIDGLSPHWPFEPSALDPWYDMVEQRLQLSGTQNGVRDFPDSLITTPLSPTQAEGALMKTLTQHWPSADVILGTHAAPLNSVEQAAETGHLVIQQGAVVREILTTDAGETHGVRFVDDETLKTVDVKAPLVFLCAGTLESTRILMLSNEGQGLGGKSDALGANIMDHVIMTVHGQGAPLAGGFTTLQPGRSVMLPRFDRREGGEGEGQRGYGVQLYQATQGHDASYFQAVSFTEMTPRSENRVELDETVKDRWGIPALRIRCALNETERAIAQKQSLALQEIVSLLGVSVSHIDTEPTPPGMAIHECGTARMGDDPSQSVLNPYNECWASKGLYVTDGSAFPSLGLQNPTLTIMALTARAVDHALNDQ